MPLGIGWVGNLGTPKGLEAIFNSKIRVPLGIGVGEWVSELKK